MNKMLRLLPAQLLVVFVLMLSSAHGATNTNDLTIIQRASIKVFCTFSPAIENIDICRPAIVNPTTITTNISSPVLVTPTPSQTSPNPSPAISVAPTTIIKYITSYIQGPQGPKGDTGPQGPAGTTYSTNNTTNQPFNTVTNTSYQYVPVSTTGATGPQGPTGLQGATGTPGIQGATGTTGIGITGIVSTATSTTYTMSDGSTTTVANPTTNALMTAGNILTTTVNGVAATSSIINSSSLTSSGTVLTMDVNGVTTNIDITDAVASSTTNSIATTTNTLQTIVNGVSSFVTDIINSFTQSAAGNILTTTINGVTATSSIVTGNGLSIAGDVMTSNVNGVSATTSLLGLSNNWYSVITNTSATSNSEDIYQIGNVGIGTNTPAYKLDVNGTFNESAVLTDGRSNTMHSGDNFLGIGLRGVGMTTQASSSGPLAFVFAGDSSSLGGDSNQASIGISDSVGGSHAAQLFTSVDSLGQYNASLFTNNTTTNSGTNWNGNSVNSYVSDSFGSASLNLVPSLLTLTNADMQLTAYPNSRDNSSTTNPINFLYTDVTGNVLSAPASALIASGLSAQNGITASGSVVELGGTLLKDTTINSAGFSLVTTQTDIDNGILRNGLFNNTSTLLDSEVIGGSTYYNPILNYEVFNGIVPANQPDANFAGLLYADGNTAGRYVQMGVSGSNGNAVIQETLPSGSSGISVLNKDVSIFAQPTGKLLVQAPNYATATIGQVLTNVGSNGETEWRDLPAAATSSPAWFLTGNSGTTAGTNFIGTTDSQDLVFKTANTERFRLTTTGKMLWNGAPDNILDTDSLANFYNSSPLHQSIINITNTYSGNTNNDGLKLGVGSGVANAFISNAENTDLYIGTNNNFQMIFGASGNIGVGTGVGNPINNTFEIKSSAASTSGLRFTNLTSSSATTSNNGKMLTVNASGDVVLVEDSAANGVINCVNSTSVFCQNGNSFGVAAALGTNDNFNLGFKTNSVEKMTLFSLVNASIGIGRTSLTGVNGGASSYSGPTLFTGSAGNFSGSTGWDFIMDDDNNASNNQIRFRANGDGAAGTIDIMTIEETSGGQVGVGTTAPNNKLEISSGTTTASRASGLRFTNLTSSSATATYNGLQLSVNSSGDVIMTPDAVSANAAWSTTGNTGTTPGTNFLGTTDAQALVFKTNNLERLRVLSDGNVGIGTTTPYALLDIYKASGFAGTALPMRAGVNVSIPVASSNGYSIFRGSGGSNFVSGDVRGLELDLNPTGTAIGKRYGFYISGETQNYLSNSLGIGTSTPNNKLEISSGTTTASGASGLRFTNLTSSSATSSSNGKLLTVNSSGDVILADIAASLSANNGLTIATNTVQLGGNLIQDTTINGTSTYGLAFSNMKSLTASTEEFAVNLDGAKFIYNVDGDPTNGINANTFYGYRAGESFASTSLGSANTVVGTKAGRMLNGSYASSSSNAFFGYGAGENLTTGTLNTLLGVVAGGNVSTAGITGMVGIGHHALLNNSGSNVIGIGRNALQDNTQSDIIGIGLYALKSNTGVGNVGIGQYTQQNNTIGTKNTTLGWGTMQNFIAGQAGITSNVAIGYGAMGTGAGGGAAGGGYNTVVGTEAGKAMLLGNSNTLLGNNSGNGLTNGSYNVFLGNNAGAVGAIVNTGNLNVIIGNGQAGNALSTSTASNEMAIAGAIFGEATYSANPRIGLGKFPNDRSILDLGGSANSLILPKGATLSQPALTLEDGMIRFDTDKQNVSMYSTQAGSWLGIYQKTYVQTTSSSTGDLLGSFDHTIILDASSNNIVQSIPSALPQYKDWELRYRAKGAASNTITILGATNNISYNGSLVTSIPMYDGEEVNMYSDGTLWYATKVSQFAFSNGLTTNGLLTQLGGNLVKDTAITNNGFNFDILGTRSSRFASNGQVSIGTTTASASTALTVDATGLTGVVNGINVSNVAAGGNALKVEANKYVSWNNQAFIQGSSSGFNFYNSGYSNKFTINLNPSISNPHSAFGAMTVGGSSPGGFPNIARSVFGVIQTDAAPDTTSGMRIVNAQNTAAKTFVGTYLNNAGDMIWSNGDMDATNNESNIATRMVLSKNGNLGIDNTAPGFLLHVGSSITPAGTSVARFENAGGTCTVTPNTVGGINCTSDINWKKNITDLDYSALDKLAGVDIKSYNMKADSDNSQKQIGFIAQNLEQYFPSLVTTDVDGNKAVSYSGMTPILVKAIKELNSKVDTNTNTSSLTSSQIQDMLVNSNAVIVLTATDTATNTATTTILTHEDGSRTIADNFTHFVRLAIEKLDNYFFNITLWTNKLKANQVCLTKSSGGEVCIDGDQLQTVLDANSITVQAPTPTPVPDPNPTPAPDTTASTTDPVADSSGSSSAVVCTDPQVLDVNTNTCI